MREEKDNDFEEKLSKLECPFTWEMEDIDKTIDTDYKPHDEEETIPLLKLMRILMLAYVRTEEDDDLEIILKDIDKCYEILDDLNQQEKSEALVKTVIHIVQATLCHVLWKNGKTERANETFEAIKPIDYDNKIERSTMNACKSIGWSKYHTLGSEEAVKFIRKALLDDPERDLWHFILGKNLRRIRRDLSVGSIPSDDEADAFLKAYNKSQNQVYGIFLAQMYREQRNNREAIRMYEQIFRSKPKSYTIYLRLALGFIQLFKLQLAKQCLDEVAQKYPEDCMYLHYRGIYYKKSKNFKMATYYLKRAADMDNYPAAKDYLICKMKIDASFDSTQYLLSLIEKFKNLPEKQIQSLLLETALSYLKKKDIKNCLKFFLHAIEIGEKSQALYLHYSVFQPGQGQNIYQVLAKEVFPLVKRMQSSLDETTLSFYKDLQNYYQENLQDEINFTQKVFSKVHT